MSRRGVGRRARELADRQRLDTLKLRAHEHAERKFAEHLAERARQVEAKARLLAPATTHRGSVELRVARDGDVFVVRDRRRVTATVPGPEIGLIVPPWWSRGESPGYDFFQVDDAAPPCVHDDTHHTVYVRQASGRLVTYPACARDDVEVIPLETATGHVTGAPWEDDNPDHLLAPPRERTAAELRRDEEDRWLDANRELYEEDLTDRLPVPTRRPLAARLDRWYLRLAPVLALQVALGLVVGGATWWTMIAGALAWNWVMLGGVSPVARGVVWCLREAAWCVRVLHRGTGAAMPLTLVVALVLLLLIGYGVI